MDLTDARWRGRVVMADPRFGTTGGHLAAMKVYWGRIMAGDAYYEAFLLGLADNDVRLLPSGNAGVVQSVADGEADVGMTDTDDVWAAQAQGRRVEAAFAVHAFAAETARPGRGALLIPNTVARVRGGPNPEHAAALIDFLLSERVERMLAESVSRNIPLRPGLAASYPELAIDDPLDVELERAAAAYERAVGQAMEALGAAR
jgi:iron(III) transport system substrate-binding protein